MSEEEINFFDFQSQTDYQIRSQWQLRSKNRLYLAYRWLAASFLLAVVIVSMHYNSGELSNGVYFIYFSRWGILMNLIVGIYGAILVTIWHFHTEFQGSFWIFYKQNSQVPEM